MASIDPLDRLIRSLAATGRDTSDFDLNPGTVLPPNRILRQAAVLVPLVQSAHGIQVILTKRSSRLKHHPGQIAFPGGKVDADDKTPVAAALREAEEEIGLPVGLVEVLGFLPIHETVTGFVIHPVVGRIGEGFLARPEVGEVDEVFSVPLAHVTDPAMFRVERRRWRGQMRHYYVVPYGPYYIWGATARILRALADRMAKCV